MKPNLTILLLLISCTLKAQLLPQTPQITLLKTIAGQLNTFRVYQSDCDLTVSLPYGRSLQSVATITTKKVEGDTLCGFYYHFNTHEGFRKNASDFSSYYNKAHYISINGSVNKTGFSENPERFRIKYIQNGYVPPIQHSSSYYYVTPYQISELITRTLKSNNPKISQKPDTIINKQICLKFILTTAENQATTKIELNFHKKEFYPVYYRKDIIHSMGGQYTTALFSNSKTNFGLPENYFSEEYLLGKDWKKNNPESPANISLKAGEPAPDWSLPVLGEEKNLSSKSLRGKYILIEFTATWCGHCAEAVKAMNTFEDRFAKNKNITIVSIFSSEIDKKEQVQSFTAQNHSKSTILYSAKDVGDKYQVRAYPSFFIVSPEGKIIKNYRGYSKNVETEIINELNKLTN